MCQPEITVDVGGRRYVVVQGTQLYEDIRMNAEWENEYHGLQNLRPVGADANKEKNQ